METENPYTSPTTDPTPTIAPGGEGMQLADLGSRFAGALIDGIILFAIAFIVGMLTFLAAGVQRSSGIMGMAQGGFLGILATVIAWAIFIAINYNFWATRGQSIGKMVVGTKIVRTDGSPAEVGRIIGHRFLAIGVLGLIPIVGGIISLVNALLVFREQRNCLHDDIADTRVIVAKKPVAG